MKKVKFQKSESNFTLIIFGASGSLAKLKLFPAIYELLYEKRMPKDFKIVGYSRTKMSDEDFRKHFASAVRERAKNFDEKILQELLKNVSYFSGSYNDENDYKSLREYLEKIEKNKNRIRVSYFSVPPSAFHDIFKNLGKVKLDTEKAKMRLVVEKPFGYDLKSAKKLKKSLYKYFKEDQFYLLDHYLGKEAVTNLLSLRYANSILTTLLNRNFVSNIQISAMESRDIEGRANYFDHVGNLRDMVQSHLLQIIAFLTMDLPKDSIESLHYEKKKLLKSLRVLDHKSIVRGQYNDYLKEDGVAKNSTTETFSAMKLEVRNSTWKGVPIYIRSGKALREQWTSIVIEFKKRVANLAPNRILIQLQPFEKIEFYMLTKLGGKTFDFHEITTGRPIYCSGDCLTEHGRLLLDVIEGKHELFLNFDEIFAAWKLIDPLQKICDKMKKKNCKPESYMRGSLGPKSADKFLQKDGFEWFNLPK